MGDVVALYPSIPEDAMFLHCKKCTEQKIHDDLSVFVHVEQDELTSWISIICEICNLKVASYQLVMKDTP